jgi:hypothetical protein
MQLNLLLFPTGVVSLFIFIICGYKHLTLCVVVAPCENFDRWRVFLVQSLVGKLVLLGTISFVFAHPIRSVPAAVFESH